MRGGQRTVDHGRDGSADLQQVSTIAGAGGLKNVELRRRVCGTLIEADSRSSPLISLLRLPPLAERTVAAGRTYHTLSEFRKAGGETAKCLY
jgi:hypothetical protein